MVRRGLRFQVGSGKGRKRFANGVWWDTGKNVRIAIVTWIERTYHRRCRQAALGRLTHRVRDHHDRTSQSGCVTASGP